jgi:hypothetical protein
MSQITINGTTYSLKHLDSQLISSVPMTDFAGKEFKKPVFVVYSCHCYSKGEKAGVPFNAPDEEVIWDGRWRREFCPQRYSLSLILPGVVERLLFSPHAYVWETGFGNTHYHELVATPNMNSQQPYYIFMRVEKAQLGESGPRVIKMAIESAYSILPPNPTPREDKALPMAVWLGKTWAPPQPGAIKNKSKKKK